MRRWLKEIIIASVLLVGVAVLCIVRWQAWFDMPEEPFWPEEPIEYTFPSSDSVKAAVGKNATSTYVVLGDVHNNLKTDDYNAIASRVEHIDAVLQVGDWMQRGQNYYYQALLYEWTRSALYGTPVIVCPGNHEYTKGINKQLSPVWKKAFPQTDNKPLGVPGASYCIDLPQVRFIVLDTNPMARVMYLTRTLTWIRSLINSAGERFIVVLMHHPVFSAAKGRINPIEFSFYHHVLSDADLVLAGHDHSYMRRAPFVVMNSAGELKPQRTKMKADTAFIEPVYGVLTIQPKSSQPSHPAQLDLRVYRLDNGVLVDSIYVQHD